MEKINSVVKLFKEFIKGTAEKAPVIDKTILVCFLTKAVSRAIGLKSRKVYTTTRIIKHLYDKKPAEEFDFILHHLIPIVMYPDHIYESLPGKRGNFCFVKLIDNFSYLCAIEVSETTN